MGIIKIKDLIFEYIRRDEEGNVEGITKAVDDVNLDIKQGDFVAILGHNGSGKSTLAKHMNAILYPSEGSVWVDGKDTQQEENIWDIRQTAGMVFQNPDNQIIGQIVEEDVGFGPENMGVETKEIWERVNESLKAVGMYEFRKFSPNKLSGGQKQRVAVARALTMDPKILLCDEATSALDPKTTNSILDLLMEINQKLGITVIIVTHQMEVVRKACNKACILENGKIADEGTVKEIFIKQPQSLRRLLSEEEEKLPDTGHNIQISYLVKDMKDGELFSTMTSELQYVFPIVNGLIQDYQGDQMGIFVINIDDEHLGVVTDYLNQKGIKWRELSGEQGETEVNE